MTEHVLVPLDGSPLSYAALRRVLTDAGRDGVRVTAIHVIDPTEPGYSTPTPVDVDHEPLHLSEEWYERASTEAESVFDAARELVEGADADVEFHTVTVAGDPARNVVDYAERHGVDRVVLGAHGREGETRLLLGRTAELVVQRAHTTVTVVRE